MVITRKSDGKEFSFDIENPVAERAKSGWDSATQTYYADRLQIVKDEKGAAANAAALSQKRTAAAETVKPATPEKSIDPEPGFWQRVFSGGKGAAKSYASGFTAAAGTTADLVSEAQRMTEDVKQQEWRDRYQRSVDDWSAKLASAKTDEERAKFQERLDGAQKQLASFETNYHRAPIEDHAAAVAKNLNETADNLSQSAAEDIAQAKQGAGKVGQFAVDLGVAGAQLAGDIGIGALTGGGALIPMAVRSFGGGAQQARQEGASLGQQVAYGAGSAALSVGIEKLSNFAKPLSKAFGAGFADEVITKLSGRLAQSAAGRMVLSALGEGTEEAVETLLDPLLQRITYDKDAEITADTLAEAGYNFLVGGALGGVLGGAGEVAAAKTPSAPDSAALGAEAAANGENATTATPAEEKATEAIVEGERTTAAEQPAEYMQKNSGNNDQVLNMPSSDDPQPTPEVPVGAIASAYSDSALTHEAKDVKKAPDAESSVGAAAAGFETPDHLGTERVSKIHSGVARYTQAEGDATARSRADYDELFRYTSQTEVQSEQQADNLLYVEVGGVRTFLRDYDTAAYEDLVRYLSDAPAWNGVMTDAAMKIKHELQGLSIDGEISEDEYTAWLTTMREHATETGRGTQAWAKWTRGDNRSGEATELEAWETLQQSDLSEEERRQLFDAIVRFDRRIEAAGSDAELRSVILEIAEQRGTLSALTGKQSKLLRKIAENSLSDMTTEQLKQFAYASSAALTQDKSGTDSGAKIKTLQMLNMMSNTKTAVTNLAGNTSFYLLDALSMDGASLLDMALSKLTGTRSVAFESSLLSRDARKSVTDAIKLSLAEATMDVNMGSGNRYQSGRSRSFKSGGVGVFNTNAAADKFAERVLSACERNMNYLMTTSDEAFKGAARSTARGTQRLVDAGKIKTKNAAYATEQAEDLAAYRTFQKDGVVATMLQGLHDMMNLKVGIGDSGKRMGRKGHVVHSFGAGDLVAPFTRVAANLASVGLDYSPVNAVKGTVEILDTLRLAALKRTVDPSKQAKAVSDFARGMSGTAIAFGVSLLAQAGLIRRAEDEDDEDVAALNQSEGMTGTQVNIDAAKRWIGGGDAAWQYGDTLIDMSRLEPLNFILSLGVEMADNEADGFLSTFVDPAAYGDTLTSTLETAGDLPVLSTVGDFTEDVQVYKTPMPEALAESLGKTAISSVTPNIVAALAKGLDDKQRNVYGSDEEGLAGVGDVLLKTLLSRIPGARENLPTTVNSLGEEKDNPGTLAQRLVAAMINPLGVNQYTQSEVSQEMERVREATGETAFYPTNRKPSELAYTDKNGVRHEVELTYEQRQNFQVARSGAQMAISADMMGNSHYRSASAKEQAALLDRVHDYAQQYAKASVLGEDSVDGWVLNSQTAQKDLGISQTDFFYYYEKYGSDVLGGGATYEKTKRMVAAGLSIDQWAKMQKTVDASGNGSTSKAELMSYIETNLPRSQWSRVFDAYKGSQKWNNPYG